MSVWQVVYVVRLCIWTDILRLTNYSLATANIVKIASSSFINRCRSIKVILYLRRSIMGCVLFAVGLHVHGKIDCIRITIYSNFLYVYHVKGFFEPDMINSLNNQCDNDFHNYTRDWLLNKTRCDVSWVRFVHFSCFGMFCKCHKLYLSIYLYIMYCSCDNACAV